MEKFPAGASQLSPRTLSLRAMAGTFRDKLAKTFFSPRHCGTGKSRRLGKFARG
jgi:hypothetical protein